VYFSPPARLTEKKTPGLEKNTPGDHLGPDFTGVFFSTTPDHRGVVIPENVFYPLPGPDFKKFRAGRPLKPADQVYSSPIWVYFSPLIDTCRCNSLRPRVFSSPLKNINGCILLLYGCISLRN
jgi:hypothetical protein